MTDTFNPHDNRTSDGVLITEGMWVLDYDRRLGKVTGVDYTSRYMCENGYCDGDHWFEVDSRPGGGVKSFNGTRLLSRPTPCCCRLHPGEDCCPTHATGHHCTADDCGNCRAR